MSRVKTLQIALCVGVALACCHAVMADSIQPAAPNYAWLFDDGSGSTATAYKGGHDGTLDTGAAWSTENPAAYTGNGSVDFTAGGVVMAGHTLGSAGTFAVWVRNTGANGYDVDNQFILDAADIDESNRSYFYDGGGGHTTQTRVNGVLVDNSDWPPRTAVTANAWHEMAWVWDNSQPTAKMSMYLDGVLKATSSTAVGSDTTPANLFFGERISKVLPWLGQMDEPAFWNTALSADNIGWLAQHSLTGAPSVLYQQTPEPSSLVLASAGVISLLAYAWRKRK
jgi:hypothetical protein